MKIAIIYGSVREKRLGLRGAKFLEKQLQARGLETVLIDPKEHPLPLLEKMYKQYAPEEAPEHMRWIGEQLESADGYILVNAEYNHSVTPALKNLLDHYQKEYAFKPGAIASYSVGSFGGARGAMALRPIIPELGMVSTPIIFSMSNISKSFDEEGNAIDESYNTRVTKFLDEFLWYADVLKQGREKGTPY